jgi:hypothetical protein
MKYRLWDTQTRTMIYPSDSTDSNTLYAIGLDGLPIAINLDPSSDEPVVDWRPHHTMVAMHSTESHDKHGKEIFACDVLLLEGVTRGVVESANGSYYVRTSDHSIPLQAIAPEMREIVGNVYENILHLPKRSQDHAGFTVSTRELDAITGRALQMLRGMQTQLEEDVEQL